jgi:Putative amidoligase enzyme
VLTKLYLGARNLISPVYDSPHHSDWWRDNIEKTWAFFRKNFTIDSSPSCGTYIKIALYKRFTLKQLKLIAQAVIHFEPAFLDLMPSYRRWSHPQLKNGPAKSILLNSPIMKGLNRPEAIDRIAGVNDISELVQLIHRPDDKHYSWNFLGSDPNWLKETYIEFRQPPGSRSAEEFISWAELAIVFVGAALQDWDWKGLKDTPTNIQALYQFIEKSYILEMYKGSAWKTLWKVAKGREKGVYQTLRRDNVLGNSIRGD